MDSFNLDFGGNTSSSSGFDSTYISETSLRKIDKAVEQANKQAGDGDVEVRVSKQRKIIKGRNFVLVFYRNIAKMLQDGEINITKTDMKVLFKLLEYAEMGNLLAFSQKSLAEELGLKPQAVSRSMNNLKNKQAIIETSRGLFFNPLIACKGNYKNVDEDVMATARLNAETADCDDLQYSFNWDIKESNSKS